MCFEADAGVTYDLYVGTAGTGFDGAGYREFRIDSFRLQERHSHEIVAIASAGNRDCVADLVGQIATGGGGMSTAGGRGRPLECEDSERPTADIQNVRVE
jgi:hypothetical protein